MSSAEAVLPSLPHLRRFARALTASQASGDAYVAATLETIMAAPSTLSSMLPARVALFKVFLRLWSSTNDDVMFENSGDARSVADRRLRVLSPDARKAYLLKTVEEFDTNEIAQILDVPVLRACELIAQAEANITSQLTTSVLIIEDEPMIAVDLETIVTDLGHEVTGIARTRDEAISLAKRTTPGLIVSDIRLADGSSGLDAVNDILVDTHVPVIFVTAYPDHLLTGERPEPAFLVTKPFRPEAVGATISNALFFDRRARLSPERQGFAAI